MGSGPSRGLVTAPRLADQDRWSEGPLRPVVGRLHPLDAEEPQEMPPLLTQPPGQTLMVPIREPSLLGDPGIQLRLPLLESGLELRRLQPPLLLPQGQGLRKSPANSRGKRTAPRFFSR